MGFALGARIHAGLTADTAGRIDEETVWAYSRLGGGCDFAYVACGYLVFRNFAAWIYGSVCQAVRALRPSPVIRNKNRVGPDRAYNHGAQCHVASPGCDGDPVLVFDSVFFRQSRMDFDSRFGILIHQRADPPRLCAREVLADDASGRQVNGILVIHRIARLSIFRHLKPCLAVGMEETVAFEQPRSSRMILGRARPEDTQFLSIFS